MRQNYAARFLVRHKLSTGWATQSLRAQATARMDGRAGENGPL